MITPNAAPSTNGHRDGAGINVLTIRTFTAVPSTTIGTTSVKTWSPGRVSCRCGRQHQVGAVVVPGVLAAAGRRNLGPVRLGGGRRTLRNRAAAVPGAVDVRGRRAPVLVHRSVGGEAQVRLALIAHHVDLDPGIHPQQDERVAADDRHRDRRRRWIDGDDLRSGSRWVGRCRRSRPRARPRRRRPRPPRRRRSRISR